MSPTLRYLAIADESFPRMSGDAPDGENQLNEEAQFSPREWG